PYDATLARVPREILGEVRGIAHVGRIIRSVIPREQEPVAADARVDRDVLLAVRPRERDRTADDAGADLELPERAPGRRVDGLEPSVEGTVEHDVAPRREAPAPNGEFLGNLPLLLSGRRIPRNEESEIAAAAGVVRGVRVEEWRAGEVGRRTRLVIHAHVVRRRIKE